MQVRPWTAADRTGGPIDAVLDELRKLLPELIVERAKPAHRGGDDNVYFLRRDAGSWRLRIDDYPAYVARGDERVPTSDPAEAAKAISGWLS